MEDRPPTIGEMLENIMGGLNVIEAAIGIVCAIVHNDVGYQFRIRRADKGGKHSFPEIKAVLKCYGVITYWYGFSGHHITFRIKSRQARWGEYVLLHAGVKLLNPAFDHRNAGYAAHHTKTPKAWNSEKAE